MIEFLVKMVAVTRSGLSTHRGRWIWFLLLTCGSCKLPSYNEYAQTRDAGNAAGGVAGTDAGGLSGGGAGIVAGGAGTEACDGGVCAQPSCTAGFADCNGVPGDGCETSLDSVDHCGRCGVECANEHGSTTCAGESATTFACAPTCGSGFADCDLDPSNGCETNLNTDSTHCGTCGFACPANGGTPRCQAGACGVSACNQGFGDCKNAGACSENLNTDPNNCGHCGHVCSSAHGTPLCNGGSCQIACEAGWGDCNSGVVDAGTPADDGCETKLNVLDSGGSVQDCGACGAQCIRRSLTTINLQQCALGVCARDCFSGQGDCDNNRNDPSCGNKTCGCETILGNNVNDCGACGHVCKGGSCASGTCECPDVEPTSGSTKCTLANTVKCGVYGVSCTCACASGVFTCTDAAGKAC